MASCTVCSCLQIRATVASGFAPLTFGEAGKGTKGGEEVFLVPFIAFQYDRFLVSKEM